MSYLFKKEVIVIVGGISSGNHLAPLFNGLGYICVHVCTADTIEHPFLKPTFKPNDYFANYILPSENDASDFIKDMGQYRVKAVIAGSEPCVEFADKLSDIFNTPRNVASLSRARRSKYLMHEILRRNGIRSARQLLTSDIQEIYDFHTELGRKVVLKPEASSNTDRVFYCDSKQQIAEAVDRILGVKDYLGQNNEKVLVQEYLYGKQYLVNTMSSNGNHYVCDAWIETRYNDDAPSNDSHADLLTPASIDYQVIAEYTSRTLDALGICYGAAHLELRISEEGPCLVEVAARMSGGVDFGVLHDTHSLTQMSLLPDALLDTASFIKRIDSMTPTSKCVRKVYLSSPLEGPVLNQPDLSLFLGIDSVSSGYFKVSKRDYLEKTDRTKGKARPGYVYMVATSPEKIEHDFELVRHNENALYEMMLRPT